MARFGIRVEDLQAAGCFRESREPLAVARNTARFGDALGHTWDGEGEVPAWLQRAVNAGQTVEHFRIGAAI
nr:H-NS histone family protein [Cupriavidus necator]